MKNILSILLLSVLFIGCSENRVDVYELTNKGSKLSPLMYYQGKLFNGIGFDLHPNGQLSREGKYKDGKEDGLFKTWCENGQLKTEKYYKDGILDSLVRIYDEKGQLSFEHNFKDDITKSWYSNGQLRYEENITEKKCWDESGNEIKCYLIE